MLDQQLAGELHKPIIKIFWKQKVHLTFIDNIWDADLANMQLKSKLDKGYRFSLCVTGICSKYAWVISLNDKKVITITNALQKILDEYKPNKIWVVKGSEFYNRLMNSWMQDNDIGKYSTHNEGQSVTAERFIRFLKNKIYKYMTSVSTKCLCS